MSKTAHATTNQQAEALVAAMGTVERTPYVGDGLAVTVKCKHGDYDKMFKGKTEQRAAKALAEHYTAKHGDPASEGVAVKVHHLDYEPPTGDSWCVECQIVFATRKLAEAHTSEPVEWIDGSCGKCTPCRETYPDATNDKQDPAPNAGEPTDRG